MQKEKITRISANELKMRCGKSNWAKLVAEERREQNRSSGKRNTKPPVAGR